LQRQDVQVLSVNPSVLVQFEAANAATFMGHREAHGFTAAADCCEFRCKLTRYIFEERVSCQPIQNMAAAESCNVEGVQGLSQSVSGLDIVDEAADER